MEHYRMQVDLTVKSQRLEHIDIARAIGMFAVIVGHVLILFVTVPTAFDPAVFSATRLIYAFHMPLFFFLSGLTYQRRGLSAAITAAVALVLLAQLTHLAGATLDYLANGRSFDVMATLRTLVLLRSFSIGVTWFLVSIAIVRLMYALLCESGHISQAIVTLLVAASLVVTVTTDSTVFQIQTWFAGLLFYALGHASSSYIRQGLLSEATAVVQRWVLVAGLAVAAVATFLTAPLNLGCLADPFATCGTAVLHGRFMVRMIAGQYGFLPLFCLTALCGTVAVLLLSQLLSQMPPTLRHPLLWVGRNSLALLVLNGCFLVVANPAIRAATAEGYAPFLPWVLALAVLAGHLVFLPLAILIVRAAERSMQRVAAWLISKTLKLWQISPANPDL